MRILMINRTTEMLGDPERIMYQLAESLRLKGHDIWFFATEKLTAEAFTGQAKQKEKSLLQQWNDWAASEDKPSRRRKAQTYEVKNLTAPELKKATAPGPTAPYGGAYLVVPPPVGRLHARPYYDNRDIAGHMESFLQQTPIDAVIVFDILGSLTWSVVNALYDFRLRYQLHLPIWVMMNDLYPLCPVGTCLCRSFRHMEECHRCAHHAAPRNEKSGDGIITPSVFSYLPCITHRCAGGLTRSYAAAHDQRRLRMNAYYDLPDGYLTASVYHEQKLIDADFTNRKIISVDLPLPPAAFEPIHRERSGYMLYIGEIARHKGLEVLIRALSMCINSENLVLCGDGPDVAWVERLADQLNVRERIHFMSGLKSYTQRKLMAEATCLIVPSLCEEVAPWGLLEMQAIGKPAIVANRGVLADRVINRRSGLLFADGNPMDLAQCMDEIHDMSDSDLLRWGNNAADDARHRYDPSLYAERVLTLLTGEASYVKRRRNRRAEDEQPSAGPLERLSLSISGLPAAAKHMLGLQPDQSLAELPLLKKLQKLIESILLRPSGTPAEPPQQELPADADAPQEEQTAPAAPPPTAAERFKSFIFDHFAMPEEESGEADLPDDDEEAPSEKPGLFGRLGALVRRRDPESDDDDAPSGDDIPYDDAPYDDRP